MGDSKTKAARLDAISTIIRESVVGSQDELMSLLKARGYDITQATLSRDLKELQVVKVPSGLGYRYQVHSNPARASRTPSGIIHTVDVSGSLMVIKTGPGFAAPVASTIDNHVVSDAIMGTIAGDDTVLVILRSPDSAGRVLNAMARELPGIKERLINKQ